jgi:hypothetical protein
MHNIEDMIKEYCAQILHPEPLWIIILNRRFPKIAARMDIARSVHLEIEDHLRNSYEAYLAKGQSPENAWKLAKEHFGNIALISKEICNVRTQSFRCLTVRLIAVSFLLILPLSRFPFTRFFHPPSLGLMAVFAAAGFLITRKRTIDSLRKYALYGAWIGLFWGIVRAVLAEDLPTELGSACSMILMSTVYGLLLAAPSSRGFIPGAMIALCQVGMSVALMRLGVLVPYPATIDLTLLVLGTGASIFSLLVGLTVFDIRRLPRRLSGLAALGMVFAWIDVCCHFGKHSILEFVFATSIPVLVAILIALPIQKLQGRLLKEVY